MVPNFTALDAMVALGSGLFEKHGLDVSMSVLYGSPEQAFATVSGTAEIALPGISGLLATMTAGKPTVGFAVSAEHAVHCVTVTDEVMEKLRSRGITPDSPIKQRVQALKGLTISTTTLGGSVEHLTRSMMKDFGVAPSEGQFTAVGDTTANLAALKRGRIDATVLSPPGGLVPVVKGYGTCLINFAKDPIPSISSAYYTTYVTSEEYAKSHPEVLKKWTLALRDAVRIIRTDPSATADSIAKFFTDISDELIAQSITSVAAAYQANPIQHDKVLGAVTAYNAVATDDFPKNLIPEIFIEKYAANASITIADE